MQTTSVDLDIRALVERMTEARQHTDKLFELVRPEALYERPISERHRIVFYIGHLEAFDWNLLQPRISNTKVFDRELDHLFAFGIDPVDGGLPTDRPSDWPSLQQIGRYRDRIRATLDNVLSQGWSGDESPQVLLNVIIEHRLMHAETLAYMLHQLPFDQKGSESQPTVRAGAPVQASTVDIPAGRATLGLARDEAAGFGWDNEYGIHSVDVPGFAVDRYKVTNGQYLKFVNSGGYEQRSLWSPSAWNWKEKHGVAHPFFWTKSEKTWRYRAMFEELPLPLDWPIYVSHAEASAYAAWAEKRLLTEPEWHRAAYGTPDGSERYFPWGAERPGPANGYFDFGRWDPSPVNAFDASESAFGVSGLLSNGWEWTSSLFQPFAGFRPFPFYEGYSANFFDGMHYVMKGGSPRTGHSMLRRSFRNWFQPHYPYVYAGFRCAER